MKLCKKENEEKNMRKKNLCIESFFFFNIMALDTVPKKGIFSKNCVLNVLLENIFGNLSQNISNVGKYF